MEVGNDLKVVWLATSESARQLESQLAELTRVTSLSPLSDSHCSRSFLCRTYSRCELDHQGGGLRRAQFEIGDQCRPIRLHLFPTLGVTKHGMHDRVSGQYSKWKWAVQEAASIR